MSNIPPTTLWCLLLLLYNRFQDGKINEALVWEGVAPGERHRVPDMAVQHLLLLHLPGGTVVQSCSTALDPLLHPAGSTTGGTAKHGSTKGLHDALTWTPAGSTAAGSTAGGTAGSTASVAVALGGSSGGAAAATAASRAADAALDALGKQLRGLSDLALKVVGVQPLSAISRHTCCFYPKPHPLAEGLGSGVAAAAAGGKVPRVLEAIDVMVQLEGTGEKLYLLDCDASWLTSAVQQKHQACITPACVVFSTTRLM
jgi:hypothetical protein